MKKKIKKALILFASSFLLGSCSLFGQTKKYSETSYDWYEQALSSAKANYGDEKSFEEGLKELNAAIENKKRVFYIADKTPTFSELARYLRRSCLIDFLSVVPESYIYKGSGYAFEFGYINGNEPSLKTSQQRSAIKELSDRTERELTPTGSNFVPTFGNWREQILVETSDQLVKAVEEGYEPVAISGSSAERIYSKALAALRTFITVNAPEPDKAAQIYKYIGDNSCYDYDYLSSKKENPKMWECHYSEGFFDNGIAVCDGFAKAYSLMANLSGVECRRLSGRNSGETLGHSWCVAKIDGRWVTIDPTEANARMSDSWEATKYFSFMKSPTYYASYYDLYEGEEAPQSDSEFDFISYCGKNASSRSEASTIIRLLKNVGEKDMITLRMSYCGSEEIASEFKSAASEAGVSFSICFSYSETSGLVMMTKTNWQKE